MADAHANFAISTVATAPSPASSGTSLVVASGDGAKFPVAPFNVTVWPAGAQPTSANAEIVRVTARSTDTLTITRAQESTSARTIVVGDQIAATVTAKTLTDAEAAGPFVPADAGILGWNADPLASWLQSFSAFAGEVDYSMIKLASTVTLANILVAISGAGSGLSNCFAAVFNAAGTRLGITANQSTVWTSIGLKTMALTVDSGQSLTVGPGPIFVGTLVGNASTTVPSMLKVRPSSSLTSIGNLASTGAARRGVFAGSALTAMPTSFNPATATGLDTVTWHGVS